jgi:thiol-disulfide isomerase/thioredoxin
MRKLVLLFTVIFFCGTLVSAQVGQRFEIKFNIKGVTAKSGDVFLYGDQNAAKFDKVTISNGKFTVSGNASAPVLVRMLFVGQQQFIRTDSEGEGIPALCSTLMFIVEPGAKYSVSGSLVGKDFVDLYPSAGDENASLAKLNRQMMPMINEVTNMYSQRLVNKSLTDDQKKQLTAKQKVLVDRMIKVKLDFISGNHSSIAAFWLMDEMLKQNEVQALEFESVIPKIDSKYASNGYFTALKTRVENGLATSIGKVCPSITSAMDVNGQPFALESLRGKYVIIDFWGTWCYYCVKGMPHMKEFRDKYADKLQIVSIANDKDEAKWKAGVEKNQMNWPNIRIGNGENYVSRFNVIGFPTKFLIGPDGTILYTERGESESFYTEVEKILNR